VAVLDNQPNLQINKLNVMKNLVGKKVSAVADWGTYKGRTVKGILSVNEITGQYLVTIKKATVSVMEDTIEACN